MKLAIVNLTRGGISGGYAKYLSNILPYFLKSEAIRRIVVFSPRGMLAGLSLPVSPKIGYQECKKFSPFFYSADKELRRRLEAFSPDLVFVPVERRLDYDLAPIVVMLQNLEPFVPNSWPLPLGAIVRRRLQRYEAGVSLRNASAVIVPTACAGTYARKVVGDGKRVVHVPYGMTAPLRDLKRPSTVQLDSQNPFVFAAGSLVPYRGFEDLISALPALRAKVPGLRLVIAGNLQTADKCYLKFLKDRMSAVGLTQGDVLWLGQLTGEELAWCYSNCSAFAVTSRVESFCLVALEAMAYGGNCVSSNATCLPEIFSDSALYYPPGDVSGLTDSILRILRRTPQERVKFSSVSADRARTFSWKRAADSAVALFAEVQRDVKAVSPKGGL